ncbi:class III extradiol ring-cleavage dioxygenase [Sphingomonas sp. BIUV-7]|uniref:Class III extradiol ring-cleavage dioxygenase n=1 Tax=Sphingomonas natans TaxID=3063330 RepID=A0ABT8Y9Q3_9SPHN|nr:class III extradiol ring-cleavage dioxygenase [Sphingomonas sp. BIUV-7]MDO6415066.1 class III extradiol ring-cleavage dioxygenase [Sphingomonas sp. BIUV-7]
MDDPRGMWTEMAAFLRGLPASLPAPPSAILLVSGHWETDGFAFTGSAAPSLIYDYYGFPPHTYELTFPVPGDPALAARAAQLIEGAGIKAVVDPAHGLDHGVFVPLKVAWPEADVPVVEMSVDRSLDPALHLAAGRALAPLRDEGVLIVGSGMSFHNMRAYGDPRALAPSAAFDAWLGDAAALTGVARDTALGRWRDAPQGAFSHPREEHLIPLMVAAGAAQGAGERIFAGEVLSTRISGYRFD